MSESKAPVRRPLPWQPHRRRGEILFLALVRIAPVVVLAGFLLPVLLGLAGTIFPAFGWLPALGHRNFSFAPFHIVFAHPSFLGALRASLVSGLTASFLALALALAFAACSWQSRWFRLAVRTTPAFLATPHAAFAVGLGFVLAPSGFVLRLTNAFFATPDLPPTIATIQDPHGWALACALVIKEFPFLVLMLFAATNNAAPARALAAAQALGYSAPVAWLKVALPLLWPQVRLPFFAVLAYSLSVTDMAILLGPLQPPTLSVLLLELFRDPDLSLRLAAAAGAVFQLALILGVLAAWCGIEKLLAPLVRHSWTTGRRGRNRRREQLVRQTIIFMVGGLGVLFFVALGLLGVWSFAEVWRWPSLIPQAWSHQTWHEVLMTGHTTITTTLALAVAVAGVAITLTLLCLENEEQGGKRLGRRGWLVLYLPLLLPQAAFLFGVQILLLSLGLSGSFLGVLWAHFLFALPYGFLVLASPWRSADPRYASLARSLGHGARTVFLRVRCRMLLRTIALAFALCFSVSVAQYLATLLVGGGWVSTLSLEAVAAASGGARQQAAAWAALLALLPLAVFALALAIPESPRHNRLAHWGRQIKSLKYSHGN